MSAQNQTAFVLVHLSKQMLTNQMTPIHTSVNKWNVREHDFKLSVKFTEVQIPTRKANIGTTWFRVSFSWRLRTILVMRLNPCVNKSSNKPQHIVFLLNDIFGCLDYV